LLLAVLGIVLGGSGLFFAWVQVRKTLRAAQAAELAAKETAARISQVTALIDIEHLCRLTAELRIHIQSEEFPAAIHRAHDLRIALAKVRESKPGKSMLKAEKWQGTLSQVVSVYDALVSMKKENRAEVSVRCDSAVSAIEELLNGLSARAASATGEHVHANSTTI